jgi:4-hydroxy-tetrahydrodipicolinate synthase
VELLGMAGGPVRLPLDDLDEKKTEQLRKILATIPNKRESKLPVSQKRLQKTKAGKTTSSTEKRAR